VKLNNIGARENGYQDAGDYRRKAYEVDNLDEIAEKFLVEMQPMYEELHGYVRYKLSKVYKELEGDDLIPAHLLGEDMEFIEFFIFHYLDFLNSVELRSWLF